MKAAVVLSLVTAALAAPTKTVESRQLPGLGGSSSSSSGGLGGLASLLPSNLPNFLGGSSGSSGSSSGGLPDLSSFLGGGSSSSGSSESDSSSSSSDSSDSSSGSGSSSSGGLPDIGSLLGGGSGGSSLLSRSDEAPKAIVETTKRAGAGSMTENDVVDNKGCKELTFIFARGTTEMGNMGSVVGPPVAKNLNSLTGNNVAVQGVDYPASAEVCVIHRVPPSLVHVDTDPRAGQRDDGRLRWP